MPHPPDRHRPHGPGETGPIEPGSALHRLLVMVAEAVARARPRTPPPEQAAPASPDPSEGPSNDTPTPDRPAE